MAVSPGIVAHVAPDREATEDLGGRPPAAAARREREAQRRGRSGRGWRRGWRTLIRHHCPSGQAARQDTRSDGERDEAAVQSDARPGAGPSDRRRGRPREQRAPDAARGGREPSAQRRIRRSSCTSTSRRPCARSCCSRSRARNGVELPATTAEGLRRYYQRRQLRAVRLALDRDEPCAVSRRRLPRGRRRLRRPGARAGLRLHRGDLLADRARAARLLVAGGLRGLLRRRGRGARAARRRGAPDAGHHARLPGRARQPSGALGGEVPRPGRRGAEPGRLRAQARAAEVPQGVRHRARGRARLGAARRGARRRQGRRGLDPRRPRRAARRPHPPRHPRRRRPGAARRARRAGHRLRRDAGEQPAHRRGRVARRAPAAGDARRRRALLDLVRRPGPHGHRPGRELRRRGAARPHATGDVLRRPARGAVRRVDAGRSCGASGEDFDWERAAS